MKALYNMIKPTGIADTIMWLILIWATGAVFGASLIHYAHHHELPDFVEMTKFGGLAIIAIIWHYVGG